MKRIGIMGGTFNPIHNGHLAVAEAAKEQFSLENVLFMPSGVPYMKNRQEVLPVAIRCEMTALAIADRPYFELSRLEAADAVQGKNTYTYETLRKLRHTDPQAAYFFILGADSLYAVEDWKNPALIFENCMLLAAVRTEESDTAAKPRHTFADTAYQQEKTDTQTENSENARVRLCGQIWYLQEKYRASVEILEFTGMDISSTQIRDKVQQGESIRGLVPEAVETYIRKNLLYEKRS